MKTIKNRHVFLVLVPHRDIRVELRKHSDLLIKNGLTGVYSFPWVVPLAVLSRPLNTNELKHTAYTLRQITGKNKITSIESSVTIFPAGTEDMELYGSKLDLNIPANTFSDASQKITSFLLPPVLGSFLIIPSFNNQNKKAELHEQSKVFARKPPCPSVSSVVKNNLQLSFRAAAVANMYWQPFQTDGETGFKWEIGKLSWLPSVKKNN
ncbi:MAG: hypothetical protein FWD13_02600 [Treponema sp.]|nr:hypothetical protein [Treponema sp.]